MAVSIDAGSQAGGAGTAVVMYAGVNDTLTYWAL